MQKKDLVTEETDKICPECSKPILIRLGRYGKFYGCSGYPECKHTEPLEEDKEKAKPKSTGIPCPECSGMIVERKTRRGKLFFGCDKFPKCEYALWNKPTGEKCPDCGQLLGIFRKTKLRCKDKECGFIKDMDNPES